MTSLGAGNRHALAYYGQDEHWGPDALTPAERERIEATLALVPDGAGSAIDVGCGDGRLTNALAERLGRVVGVDVSDAALAHVRGETLRASATDLPVEDRSFDLAVATELLEHLPDVEHDRAVSELARVAERHVLVSVPNGEHLKNAHGRCPRCGEVFHVHRHARSYDIGRMRDLVPGFALTRLVEHGPAFHPPRDLDVRVQHGLLGSHHHSPTAVCPACGHAGTEPPRARRLARAVRATRRVPPGRTRPQWILAVYERRRPPRAAGGRNGDPGARRPAARNGDPAVHRGPAARPRHVLIVSYLHPPSDASAVRRPVGIRHALEDLGVRTTVLTSAAGGTAEDDKARGVIRTRDLRSRLGGERRSLAGLGDGPIVRTGRRRLTRFIVPDTTAVTWFPEAALAARRLAAEDPPDLVFTTSPPESVHLVGLALARRGIPWIADLRDGWTFEPPSLRPYARPLDRALEGAVVRRADAVTAVTAPIADDLARRHPGARVVHLTNGFDPRAIEAATDERPALSPDRFSLVYTGSGAVDGKNLTLFLRALGRALREHPGLRDALEVVLAGNFTEDERAAIAAPELRGVVRSLGRVPHARALGLQRAADGLLLITTAGSTQVATAKIFEYLEARRPVLALASGNVAEELLERAGGHVCAAPDDEVAVARALADFARRRIERAEPYEPAPGFDAGEFSFDRIAERLLELAAGLRAGERR